MEKITVLMTMMVAAFAEALSGWEILWDSWLRVRGLDGHCEQKVADGRGHVKAGSSEHRCQEGVITGLGDDTPFALSNTQGRAVTDSISVINRQGAFSTFLTRCFVCVI